MITLQMLVSIGLVIGSTAWAPALSLVSMRHPTMSANWRVFVSGVFSFSMAAWVVGLIWFGVHLSK